MSQTRPAPLLGHQPALDGLRAVSVGAVILYHAGFSWFGGGFLGVEVFFVISGFLITTLLIEEHRQSGRVSLAGFWHRRARRLLPALFLMLVTVSAWAMLFGSAARQSELRRDLPWSVLYAANWGQIVHGTPYFSDGEPALTRHLWSLGVEEQWYLLWPLVFVVLLARRRRPATTVLGGVGAVWFVSWWVHRGGWIPVFGRRNVWDTADRINIDYLSTFTRAGGLLIGAAGAFAWQVWRRRAGSSTRIPLDIAAAVALGVLLGGCIGLRVTDGALYPWMLAVMSLASLVLVFVAVHPHASRARAALTWRPLTEIGRRSYGLYLWHWPIFVIAGATGANLGRVVPALAIAVVVTEISYRCVEVPIRAGALSRWWRRARSRRWVPVVGPALLTSSLLAFYVQVSTFDAAAGGAIETFDPIVVESSTTTAAPPAAGQPRVVRSATSQPPATQPLPTQPSPTRVTSTVPAGEHPRMSPPAPAATTAPAPSFTYPERPVALALVGDSQAISLAANLPAGIERAFAITDGGLAGCSVHSSGEGLSTQGFQVPFDKCEDWETQWKRAVRGNDIALVTLGAWDVLDYRDGATTLPFGTAGFDHAFMRGLEAGIALLSKEGVQTALMEVPCMRPPEHPDSFTPQLPERLDDSRVAHLNRLLRQVAAQDPEHVTFITGPQQWCNDELIATDLEFRRDGVHVLRPGAKLVFDTIAAQLLAIPVS